MQNMWPDNFDLADDPAAAERIHGFIEEELSLLKEFDDKRQKWAKENLPDDYEMTYFFYDHAYRVAEDIKKTALHMGLSQLAAENMYWAMLPHDIGKHTLPLDIWDMVEKPEDEIKHTRRSHTLKGSKIVYDKLGDLDHPFVNLILDIMINHHEQMDGSGYQGKTGDQLSAPVRLAAIIESFDGYSIARPHFGDRDISVPGVLKRMREEKGAAWYDMKLFEAFAEMKMKEYNES